MANSKRRCKHCSEYIVDPQTQQPAYWPIEFEVSSEIPDWLDRLIAGYVQYGITRKATMLEF